MFKNLKVVYHSTIVCKRIPKKILCCIHPHYDFLKSQTSLLFCTELIGVESWGWGLPTIFLKSNNRYIKKDIIFFLNKAKSYIREKLWEVRLLFPP